MVAFRTKARVSRWLTLLSYAGLLVLFTLWHLVLHPIAGNPWVIWAWHSVPLLAFAPVMIKGTPRGHAWLCFLLLLYFVQAVLSATNPNTAQLGLIYALLVAVLFTSAMLYTRWQSRYAKEMNQH